MALLLQFFPGKGAINQRIGLSAGLPMHGPGMTHTNGNGYPPGGLLFILPNPTSLHLPEAEEVPCAIQQ